MSKLTDPVYESVRVKLTQDEVLDFGQRLAQELVDSRVRDKYEYRDVECHWDLDMGDNPPKRKHLVRQDTFECVRTTMLSAEEIVEINQFKLPMKD